jgi:hypothetical protein
VPTNVEANFAGLEGVGFFHGSLLCLERRAVLPSLAGDLFRRPLGLLRHFRRRLCRLGEQLSALGFSPLALFVELLAFFVELLENSPHARVHSVVDTVTQLLPLRVPRSARGLLARRIVARTFLRRHLVVGSRGGPEACFGARHTECGGGNAVREQSGEAWGSGGVWRGRRQPCLLFELLLFQRIWLVSLSPPTKKSVGRGKTGGESGVVVDGVGKKREEANPNFSPLAAGRWRVKGKAVVLFIPKHVCVHRASMQCIA